jgi:hypothetical protein
MMLQKTFPQIPSTEINGRMLRLNLIPESIEPLKDVEKDFSTYTFLETDFIQRVVLAPPRAGGNF